MPKSRNIIVVSVGGSLIAPKEVNISFLKKFRSVVLSFTRKGYRFVFVVGGGKVARMYQQAARKTSRLPREDADWVGIAATRLNAELLRIIFKPLSYEFVLTQKKDIDSRIRSKIIVASGFVPGSSTDYIAVQLAKAYGARQIINLSNIDWVYTKDPRRYTSAKKIPTMTWKQFRAMFGSRWNPGANVPFDPVASFWAERWGMEVVIANGNTLASFPALVMGKPSIGTRIR